MKIAMCLILILLVSSAGLATIITASNMMSEASPNQLPTRMYSGIVEPNGDPIGGGGGGPGTPRTPGVNATFSVLNLIYC